MIIRGHHRVRREGEASNTSTTNNLYHQAHYTQNRIKSTTKAIEDPASERLPVSNMLAVSRFHLYILICLCTYRNPDWRMNMGKRLQEAAADNKETIPNTCFAPLETVSCCAFSGCEILRSLKQIVRPVTLGPGYSLLCARMQ